MSKVQPPANLARSAPGPSCRAASTTLVTASLSDQAKELIRCIRDLPFCVIPDRSLAALLRHGVGSCTAKHWLLHQLLADVGIISRIVYMLLAYDPMRIRIHRYCELNVDEVYPHTSLQVCVEGQFRLVDITFDRFIDSVAPVNELLGDEDFAIGRVERLTPHRDDQLGRRAHLGLPPGNHEPSAERWQRFKDINKSLARMRVPHLTEILANHAKVRTLVQGEVQRG